MSDSPKTPYLGRYLVVLVLGMVGMMVLNIAARMVFGVGVPSGAATVIPPMIAALHVGQVWGRERAALPTNAEAWRFAFVSALIFLAVQMIQVPLLLGAVGGDLGAGAGVLVFVLALATICVLLVNRFMVVTGAKGGMRGQ